MSSATNKEQTTIKIRKATHEKLKEIRKNQGISMAFLVDQAINEYIEKRNKRKE
jgi:predicted DNA-binding protein|nr:MAG TPA: hypothetical protein [Caudoviricetes sp.]DAS17894.1 MAG TPA: hypothetical protein [Caudoviricetes sp.]